MRYWAAVVLMGLSLGLLMILGSLIVITLQSR